MEPIIEKYDKLRKEVAFIPYKSLKACEDEARKIHANEKLTESERTDKVTETAGKLFKENIDKISAVTNEKNKIDEQWRKELFAEFGVSCNPKRDKCYALAYEHGHSSGYSEIYNYFSEFVTLIQ